MTSLSREQHPRSTAFLKREDQYGSRLDCIHVHQYAGVIDILIDIALALLSAAFIRSTPFFSAANIQPI